MFCGWRRRLHEISCRLTCSIEAAYLDVMPTSMNLGMRFDKEDVDRHW